MLQRVRLPAVQRAKFYCRLRGHFSCDQLYSEARRITSQMHDIADVRDEDADMERLEFVGGVLVLASFIVWLMAVATLKAAQEEYDQLKARLC